MDDVMPESAEGPLHAFELPELHLFGGDGGEVVKAKQVAPEPPAAEAAAVAAAVALPAAKKKKGPTHNLVNILLSEGDEFTPPGSRGIDYAQTLGSVRVLMIRSRSISPDLDRPRLSPARISPPISVDLP